MTTEEKDILFKDLCGRLPYKVKVEANVCARALFPMDLVAENLPKPYLRPMSSMTEEEIIEFTKLFYKWHDDELFDYIEGGTEFSIWKHKGISPVLFDWLNAHHFDFRNLIGKGLALDAPDGMYKTKTE